MNSSFSFSRLGVISRIEQAAVRRVLRRVHGRQLVAERQLVAVLLDEVAHVVALERHREAGERPGHRVARRERRGVVVDRDRFVVPRDHHHVVVRSRAAPDTARGGARSTGTGRRRARCRGRSRSRRSRLRFTGRSQHRSTHLVLDDLVVGQAELEQDLVGVLAVVGRAAHRRRRLVELHRVRRAARTPRRSTR